MTKSKSVALPLGDAPIRRRRRKAARRKARRTIVRAPARRNGRRRDIEARRAFSDMGDPASAGGVGRASGRPALAERPGRGARVPCGPRMQCAALAPAATVGRRPAPGAPKPSSRRRPVPAIRGAGARGSPPRPEPGSREASDFAVSASLAAGPSIRQFTKFCQNLIRIPRAKCFGEAELAILLLWDKSESTAMTETLAPPASRNHTARAGQARREAPTAMRGCVQVASTRFGQALRRASAGRQGGSKKTIGRIAKSARTPRR